MATKAKVLVTEKDILADMAVTAPWLYKQYLDPRTTDAQRKTFLKWGKEAAAGTPATPQEIAADTYSWDTTQTWTANQVAQYQKSFTNPGQFQAEMDAKKTELDSLIQQKGLKIDSATYDKALNETFMMGYQISDPRVVSLLTNTYHYDATATDPNAVPVVNQATKSLSSFAQIAAAYGIPMPKDATKIDAFVQAAIGPNGTTENFLEYAKAQAKILYPFMGSAIDAGATVKGYLQPYATQIENTLDLLPGSINWQDSKWQSLVAKPDPAKPGLSTPQNMNEILTTIKTDPQYGYDKTMTAKNSAYDLAANIKQHFGKAS